jgi:tetratricopeptide (TPR) repeat protein
MKNLVALILFTIICISVTSNTVTDSLLTKLDEAIENREHYDANKYQNINDLKRLLATDYTNVSPKLQFDIFLRLCKEYESFNFDSAFVYVIELQHTAYKLNNKVDIAISKMELGFVYLSSGMFKEAIDTLQSIQSNQLPDSLKIGYFGMMSRTYSDLDSYDKNKLLSSRYLPLTNNYIDSAIRLCDSNSLGYLQLMGVKYMKNSNLENGLANYEKLLHHFKLDDHNYAMTKTALSYIYKAMGRRDIEINLLIEAAIYDIKASVKETLAMRNLAQSLYEKGNVKEAYRYIKIAIDDASFYNARHRKEDLATILPIIEKREMDSIQRQKRHIIQYSVSMTALSIIVVVLFIIIYRQFRNLKSAKNIISKINSNLQETNNKLTEANKIKEEYIGYYFNIYYEYIDKIEQFKKILNRKLTAKMYGDIETIVNNLDPKKEREELYISFDKVFLKLFPDFVNKFNSLFNKDDRIILKDNQLLNIDLRIFALIRIGISDMEKISKILGYSVNTIYTYKTKIKNKSIVENDEFERLIKEI